MPDGFSLERSKGYGKNLRAAGKDAMNDNIAIRAEHVAKKFCRSLRTSMWYGTLDIVKSALRLGTGTEMLRKNEFWAIEDISFEVKREECLGIIGPNGSGKSTMLKMLNGIFLPDRGRIEIRGKVGALIELGAGFHPMLTGRENIYVGGAVLGMSKSEVDRKLDEVIAFADIGDFIDAPIKNYSSGMLVRLGFALASHCEPDILLMDEVLAVGDLSFQKKCYDRMDKLINSGIATVVVSHRMDTIRRLATKTLAFLGDGKSFYGDPDEAILRYFETTEVISGIPHLSGMFHTVGDREELFVHDLKITDGNNQPVKSVAVGSPVNLTIFIRSKTDAKVPLPVVWVGFRSRETSEDVACVQTPAELANDTAINRGLALECRINELNIMPGTFDIVVKIGGFGNRVHDVATYQQPLEVIGTKEALDMTGLRGRVFLRNTWGLNNRLPDDE